jgi:hypothetical protein
MPAARLNHAAHATAILSVLFTCSEICPGCCQLLSKSRAYSRPLAERVLAVVDEVIEGVLHPRR